MILRFLLLLALGFPAAYAQSGPEAGAATVLSDTGARPVPRDINSVAPNITRSSLEANAPKLSPVFFPAAIPVLNSALPPVPAVRDSIWTDLGPHANELFFAPLGTRLSSGELNRRFRQRLDVYLEARTAALEQLRAALQPTGEPVGTALEKLRATQDAGLEKLFATADEFRRELYRGSFLVSNADWNAYRNWRLGTESKRSAQELLYDEFSVLRAATYYQEGLSQNQRHLLREIALELSEAIGERTNTLGESFEVTQVIYFLPHGARITVPSGISASLATEIDEFTSLKNSLKRELREALFTLDAQSDGKREKQLQELATRQEPAFAQLEQRAEKIRRELFALPAADRPAIRSEFPADLAARINRYLQQKSDLQRTAQQTQETVAPKDKSRDTAPNRRALAGFEEKNQAKLAALAEEARAIRTEVARYGAASGAAAKTVDALLADFMEAFKQQQLQALYQDYATAVLTPGLSPAQRQLLFNAAIGALNLPGVKDWQAVPE